MSKDYDPRMHTAEHVLGGVLTRRFHCPRAFSTHINPKKSKADFVFSRALSEGEAREVEEEVNAILARRLPITASFLPRGEAAARFQLGRLPEDAGDQVRIVWVGDPAAPSDACPCIGEHVENTAQCGRFLLISHQWEPDPEKGGVLRVRFRLSAE